MKRRDAALGWTGTIGVLLMVALAGTLTAQVSKSRGGSPGVSLSLSSGGTYESSAEVTICGDALCTGKKTFACPTLTASAPGYTAGDTCGSGGGWKGYQYTITVNGSTCSGTEPVNTAAPTCIVNGETASLDGR